MIKRPMLAARIESEDQLKFPMWVSPKLDGIRCIQQEGTPLTRKFKGIPNKYICWMIKSYLGNRWFDGELVTPGNFNDAQSAIMSHGGEPKFEYWVFDYVKDPGKPWIARYAQAQSRVEKLNIPWLKIVPHHKVENLKDFLWHETNFIAQGYEGIMGRDADGLYKFGRSTVNQGWLVKLKRFEDSEAVIVGWKQWEENQNPQEVNELGLNKRSHKKAGMVLRDTLGSIEVKDIHGLFNGEKFFIGTGFDDDLRKKLWDTRDKFLLNKVVRYSYQKHGTKDLPRFPTFQGFRDRRDL